MTFKTTPRRLAKTFALVAGMSVLSMQAFAAGDADPQWVAELKQAGARQQNVAINTKSETPDRAQN